MVFCACRCEDLAPSSFSSLFSRSRKLISILNDSRLEHLTVAEREHPAILFDGVCNLCSGTVDFIIKRDPEGLFRFASLQSEAGRTLLTRHAVDSNETDSVLLIEEGRVFDRSTAALRIARHIGGLWTLFFVFVVVPKPLRDALYSAVAKRRYRWFGEKETCRVPTPEERSRFLG